MMLYNIRKTVASFYQMKNTPGYRIEKSAEGLVKARYTRSIFRGLKRIVRRVRSKDVLELLGAQKGQRRRDTKFRLTTSCLLKNGRVERVNQRLVFQKKKKFLM